MQMMLLLLVQEQLVLPLLLGLGYQRRQMLQPLQKLLQERSFSFCYFLCRKRAYLVGHDLLQAQRMFDVLSWCQFAIISYTLEKLQRLND
jgi:hypothetical protein